MIHTLVPHLVGAVIGADNADNVRPGWIPLLIVIILGACVAFLYFSMKKQLGKIDIPEDEPTEGDEGDGEATPSAPA
jgi:hypothetical protein